MLTQTNHPFSRSSRRRHAAGAARSMALLLALSLILPAPASALRGLNAESPTTVRALTVGLEETSRERAKAILKRVREKPPEKRWLNPAQGDFRERIRRALARGLETAMRREQKLSVGRAWYIVYPLSAKLARHVNPSKWDAPLQEAIVDLVVGEIKELRQEPLSLSWSQVSLQLPKKSSREVRALFDSLSERFPRATPTMLQQLLGAKEPLLQAQQMSDRWRPEPPAHGKTPPAGLEEASSVEVLDPRVVGAIDLQAVFWDHDETLWLGYPREMTTRLFAEALGVDMADADTARRFHEFYKSVAGLKWSDLLAEAARQGWPVPADLIEGSYTPMLEQRILEEVQSKGLADPEEYLTPGSKELLAALRAARNPPIRQGIVTGATADSRDAISTQLGIREFFDVIHGDGGKQQRVVEQMRDWGVEAGQAVGIGDSRNDIAAFRRAGIWAFGFVRTAEDRESFFRYPDGTPVPEALRPHAIIHRDFHALDEILKILLPQVPLIAGSGGSPVLSHLQEWLARPEVTGGKGIRARTLTGIGRKSYDALVLDQAPTETVPELRGGLAPLLGALNAQGPFTWVDAAGGLGAALMQGALLFPNVSGRLVDAVQWTEKDFDPAILDELRTQAALVGVDLLSRKPPFLQGDVQSVDLRPYADPPIRLITMLNALAYNENPLAIVANLYNQLDPGGVLLTNLYIPAGHAKAADLVKFYERLQEHLKDQGVEADFRIRDFRAMEKGELNAEGDAGPFPELSVGIVLRKQENQRLKVIPRPQSEPFAIETVRVVTYQVAWYGEDPSEVIQVSSAAGLEEGAAGKSEELRRASERGVRGGGEAGAFPTTPTVKPIPQENPLTAPIQVGSLRSPLGKIRTLNENSTTRPPAAANLTAQEMGLKNNPVMKATGSRSLNTSMTERARNSNRFSNQNEVRTPSMILENISRINNNPSGGLEEDGSKRNVPSETVADVLTRVRNAIGLDWLEDLWDPGDADTGPRRLRRQDGGQGNPGLFPWGSLREYSRQWGEIFDLDLQEDPRRPRAKIRSADPGYRFWLVQGKEQDLWFHFHYSGERLGVGGVGPLGRPGFLAKLMMDPQDHIEGIGEILVEPADFRQLDFFVPMDARVLPEEGVEVLTELIQEYVLRNEQIKGHLEKAIQEIRGGKRTLTVLGQPIHPGGEDLYDLVTRRELGRNLTWEREIRQLSKVIFRRLDDLSTSGLEEAGVWVMDEERGTGIVIPRQGLLANWYTAWDGVEVPSSLLGILDPERGRIMAPTADIDSRTALFAQKGVLSGRVVDALEAAGVRVEQFDLESVPAADPERESVYLLDVPAGSEREWVLDPNAVVVNFRSSNATRRPDSPEELGALINVAREADGRILRVGAIYRSDLHDDLIAIDTQL